MRLESRPRNIAPNPQERDVASLLRFISLFATLLVAIAGCRAQPKPAAAAATVPTTGLSALQPVESVDARCTPPIGWRVEPLKSSARHRHQVWLSPTGKTAYGVIHFTLPFPLGSDLVLWAFLREMRKSEGEAVLLHKVRDPELPGIRFVAEGGLYRMRANLQVRGSQAWAVYAGTLRRETILPDELDLAERAREQTQIGLDVDD